MATILKVSRVGFKGAGEYGIFKPSIHRSKDRMKIRLETTLLVIALAVKVVWAVVVYDDWTCAFADCRKIK